MSSSDMTYEVSPRLDDMIREDLPLQLLELVEAIRTVDQPP